MKTNISSFCRFHFENIKQKNLKYHNEFIKTHWLNFFLLSSLKVELILNVQQSALKR